MRRDDAARGINRAVVFDLDDTLYPLRRFVLSGFRAVARTLHERHGIDARRALGVLTRSSKSSARRGFELQACADTFGLSDDVIAVLVDVIRTHEPTIRLPRDTQHVLRELRHGWKLGVLTNGAPDMQARKVRALGLEGLVDAVVYAHAVGDGTGKPAPEPFLEVLRLLAVAPQRAVFVGDDPHSDVLGAARVGMHTVQVMKGESLLQIPHVAARFVGERWSTNVA